MARMPRAACWPLVPIAVVALALAACSPPQPPASGRIAAKVNGSEISVQRFQLLFARATAQGAQKPTPALFMDSLIDRELLAQKALEFKLDYETGVALALADAKANILAQAYLEHAVGSAPEKEAAVTSLYEDNPQLFEKRR